MKSGLFNEYKLFYMRFSILCVFLLLATITIDAQKYLLLDKEMSRPAYYANEFSATQKYSGFFPVEAGEIERFITVLHEISQALSSKNITGNAKQYQVGCDKFEGRVVHLASGNRLDYIITSNCDKMKITMHLSDAKLNNENNAYFINAWISYIENAVPKNS
jgi:hypothetical protein